MQHQPPGRVADYTDAALIMALVNLVWIFAVIWAVWGLVPVLIAAVVLNGAITRLARRRDRDQA